ncbi:hypothetical protein N7G274_005962 [Stereocaulon virgatum]|uniref:BTB domain-containing protein n=1 Tax=Stereocaulon virgatum TaxID=373712 RepID=A0ABR4A8Y5_9LECA
MLSAMEQSSAPLKLRDVPVLTLRVGPGHTAYHVHQDLLFDMSKTFKTAFSGKFQESSDRSMDLPDDDVESFEQMARWFYTKDLGLPKPITAETNTKCYWQLAKLNTLADKYEITTLSNIIVDKLFELHGKQIVPPQMDVVTYVYENTTEKSSFRKLMVAWHVWSINYTWYKAASTRRSILKLPEFAADLAIALALKAAFITERNPLKGSSSDYHES